MRHARNALAAIVGMVIGLAFAIVGIVIIGVTIRITVLQRATEIAIMRLVGATNRYIREPFLLEGAIKGVLGGLLAVLMCWLLFLIFRRTAAEVSGGLVFFGSPEIARFTIMVLDAWTFIPFMMIMILAGLQAIPKELTEAAKVDGAGPWKTFWEITFPLMLPVSVTATLIRIIFKLKLADVIINVTSGGPGGATDSVTSFIFREYRDRSNVGYGTLLAFVYLVIIVVFITLLLNLVSKRMQKLA